MSAAGALNGRSLKARHAHRWLSNGAQPRVSKPVARGGFDTHYVLLNRRSGVPRSKRAPVQGARRAHLLNRRFK
ncbi:hypothetical protein GCM10009563_30220 [Subtercola frigoramans]